MKFNLKTWQDPRINWNPQDYDNITEITLPINRLWVNINQN